MTMRHALLFLIACTASACALAPGRVSVSSTAPPVTTASPAQAATTDALHSGPPMAWASMGFDARKAYMRATVVPAMEPLFLAYDDAYFDDFGCATCHGDDAEARRFAMPNADLRTLYPTGSQEQKDMLAEDRDVLVFMFGTVAPHMKALLGAPDYDPATQTGFSCYACHPKGIPAAAPL
jgi:hypothetical protein